jgi:hypothetical protein
MEGVATGYVKKRQDRPQRLILSSTLALKTAKFRDSKIGFSQEIQHYLAGFYTYPVATPISLLILCDRGILITIEKILLRSFFLKSSIDPQNQKPITPIKTLVIPAPTALHRTPSITQQQP